VTHLKPHERFYNQNYYLYQIDRHPERKGETAIAVRKGIPNRQVDLPPLVSIEATGICIPISNCKVLLAAGDKSQNRTWRDIDITELLRFGNKCILAGDLNAKHLFWNSIVLNPSGEKLLQLFDVNNFKISASQYPTHYSPAGNGDMLDTVVRQNIRLSHVVVSDFLDLPVVFHILDHVTTKKLSEPLKKFTDWERFQNTASNLISPRIEINSGVEADKTAFEFTASLATAYRLSTSKFKLSEVNSDIPGLDRLLKHNKRLRKLWQETRDPMCKKGI
jgi:hypothetical protein